MARQAVGPNDGLRLGLELAALGALAYWGWTSTQGLLQVGAAVGLPLVAAFLWGTFRVPGDPGDAPVAVPGPIRLCLETAVFGAATLALVDAGSPTVGAVFGAVVAAHYVVARDRVQWLLGAANRN